MKKFLTLLAIGAHLFFIASAQNAVLHVSVANSKSLNCWLYMPGQPNQSSSTLVFNANNTSTHTFKLASPAFVQLNCYNPKDYKSTYFNYLLYITPGDDIKFKANLDSAGYTFKVSGKGSNNNQPLLSAMELPDIDAFNGDTLPYRVINAINTAQKYMQATLRKYIALYKPSAACITGWKTSLGYYACELYYEFKDSNKFSIGGAYDRNYAAWQKIADSLFSAVKLNNDAALSAFRYQQLGRCFLTHEREHFKDSASLNQEAFYREWYNADTVEGRKRFDADTKNEVKEMLINHYFAGKTAEYLYAVLLNEAITEDNPQNIPAIFTRFKNKYPNSEYTAQLSSPVDAIIAKQQRTLNDKMVFLPGNGKAFTTLSQVLAAVKGKTVLVDMWGTWCGPCREEIEKNSQAIREHFKYTPLDYLYIDNLEPENEAKWKSMIAYLNIEGMHLLASQQLTDDIMAKVKGTGYPTVFIIKKDGTVELSKTAYPVQRDVLIKQLEDNLGE